MTLRFVFYLNPIFPLLFQFRFHDNHFQAEMYWIGLNNSAILIMLKDPWRRPDRPSHFYISRDHGSTYENITDRFQIPNQNVFLVTDQLYASPSNKQHYIVTAKRDKYIFISTDGCKSFHGHRVTFTPTKIVYSPTDSRYLLAHDEDDPQNKVSSFGYFL